MGDLRRRFARQVAYGDIGVTEFRDNTVGQGAGTESVVFADESMRRIDMKYDPFGSGCCCPIKLCLAHAHATCVNAWCVFKFAQWAQSAVERLADG